MLILVPEGNNDSNLVSIFTAACCSPALKGLLVIFGSREEKKKKKKKLKLKQATALPLIACCNLIGRRPAGIA